MFCAPRCLSCKQLGCINMPRTIEHIVAEEMARALVVENSGKTFSDADDFARWLESAALRYLRAMEAQTIKRCADVVESQPEHGNARLQRTMSSAAISALLDT